MYYHYPEIVNGKKLFSVWYPKTWGDQFVLREIINVSLNVLPLHLYCDLFSLKVLFWLCYVVLHWGKISSMLWESICKICRQNRAHKILSTRTKLQVYNWNFIQDISNSVVFSDCICFKEDTRITFVYHHLKSDFSKSQLWSSQTFHHWWPCYCWQS